MSITVMSQVYATRLGGSNLKAVALKLADCANDDGGSIFPSVQTIAKHTELSESTARRCLQELLKSGILEVERAGGKGPRDTTHYRFNLTRLAAAPRVKDEPQGCQSDTLPKAPSKGVTVTAKGVRQRAKGVTVTPDPSLITIKDQDRSLSLKADERRRLQPAVVPRFVSEDALEQVRKAAPGWDRQFLLRKFLDWPGSKKAQHMDAAFLAWVRSFTKGKVPTGAKTFTPREMPKEREWDLT